MTPMVKCLLVDDLEENLLALSALLESEDVQVLTARSGPEALELLLVEEVALVFLDVQMPGMDGFELAELMRGFVELRIRPYYLHHPDLAPGTSHFRVSIAEGQALVKGLRGRISGLAQPTYILDIPGGHGKAVIEASTIRETGDGRYAVEDFRGAEHAYPPKA